MNQADTIRKRIETIKSYHTPGCDTNIKRAKNGIFISPSNSLLHEFGKTYLAMKFKKDKQFFITEATRNKKDSKGKERRVDFVGLDDGWEYELEKTQKRAERFKNESNVIVMPLWDKELNRLCNKLEKRFEAVWGRI